MTREVIVSPLLKPQSDDKSHKDTHVTLKCSCCFGSVPDCHPSGVRHSHQEDQNGHPGAKRSGDRHSKRQGERDRDVWFSSCDVTHERSTLTGLHFKESAHWNIKSTSQNNTWTELTVTQTNQNQRNFRVLLLQYVFVSFLSRDNTYKVLMSVCLHLEVGHTSQI